MWRQASFVRSRLVRVLACVLALSASVARAQTIADYSRAQRAMLESAMAQAAARSAGSGAPMPAATPPASASAPSIASGKTPMLVEPRRFAQTAESVLQVNGVFASSGGSLAEVLVDATPYLLRVGERVPGTSWHVEAVEVDQVVLGRRTRNASTDGEGGRRIFALPALR